MKAIGLSLMLVALASFAWAEEDELDGPSDAPIISEEDEATIKALEDIPVAEGWGGEEGENEGKIAFLLAEAWEPWKTLMKSQKLPWMTMFYAPWCGHCKALKADYAIVSNKITDEKSLQCAISAVDCDKDTNKELCNAEGVEGFPTLKWYVPGQEPKLYNGERNWRAIMKFIRNEVNAITLSSLNADSDISGLKISALKKALKDRGVDCHGCVDKTDYVKTLKKALKDGVEVIEESSKENPKRKTIKEIKAERRMKAAKKVVEAGWEGGNGKVQHLIAEGGGFDKFREEVEHAAVMFYAPWCSHCDTQKPNWVAASETAAESDDLSDVTFASVECVANDHFCKSYDIQGYPTMYFLEKDSEKKNIIYGRGADDVLDEIRGYRGLPRKNVPEESSDEEGEESGELEEGDDDVEPEEGDDDVEPDDHDEL